MGILWELALQATLEKHLAQLDCSLMWSHSFIMISKRLQEQFHACKCNCVCLCECERLCMRDCVHACVCACARVQMCTRMHVCASACIHTCVCVCMCVFMLQQLLMCHHVWRSVATGTTRCPAPKASRDFKNYLK
jgi:hypothetical protein